MQPPMIGSWNVLVHAARPYEIHSDRYYELHVTRLDADPSQGLVIRVPQHAIAKQPDPGDRLAITFLMGQVTAVAPVPS